MRKSFKTVNVWFKIWTLDCLAVLVTKANLLQHFKVLCDLRTKTYLLCFRDYDVLD